MIIETQIPGITDHSLLSGLSGDDHTQYVLADGSRAMTYLKTDEIRGNQGNNDNRIELENGSGGLDIYAEGSLALNCQYGTLYTPRDIYLSMGTIFFETSEYVYIECDASYNFSVRNDYGTLTLYSYDPLTIGCDNYIYITCGSESIADIYQYGFWLKKPLEFDAAGYVRLSFNDSYYELGIDNDNGPSYFSSYGKLTLISGTEIELYSYSDIRLTLGPGDLIVDNLATSDPQTDGALWVDGSDYIRMSSGTP